MNSHKEDLGDKISQALSHATEKAVDLMKKKNMANLERGECGKTKSTLMQITLGLITNFSSMAPSMSLGFSAVALPALRSETNSRIFDVNQLSWIASIASVATPVGCFISGPVSDRYGRRSALICINVVCFLGWAVISLAYCLPAQQYWMLLVGRLITGLSTGLASMPASVYMAEMSSANLRGMFTTWNAVSFAVGVLLIYALGWVMQDNWGMTAAIAAVFPCISLVFVLLYMPESSPWLISKNRIAEAKVVVSKLYKTNTRDSVIQEEIEGLQSMRDRTKSDSTLAEKLKIVLKPIFYKPFVLITTYFFFQQFSGVFVIVFYAVDIVKEVKIVMDPYLAICLIAFTRVMAAIVVGIISKKVGRRPLSLISGGSMAICMVALAGYMIYLDKTPVTQEIIAKFSWIPTLLLMLYFLASTFGFLTMPFAMAAEVFPGEIRGLATGMVTCLAYLFNFVIVKLYPAMITNLGAYKLFFLYGAFSLLGTIFVLFFLPETRGKTLQEIEEYFGGKQSDDDDDHVGRNRSIT